jgi:ribonuclease Z
MSQRTFFALGTASQVPTRHRNHNGYFLRWDTEGILFDPGEGTQRQMTFSGVAASGITRILITHFHGDHCLGLAGVLQRLSLDGVEHPVEVHYPAYGQRFFENLRDASVYHKRATIVPKPFSQPGVLFETKGLKVETAKLDHSVESWGFRVQEHDRRAMDPVRLAQAGLSGPIIKRIQQDGEVTVDGRVVTLDEVSDPKPGQSFAFVMDTRPCRGALTLARDVDILVCESTYLNEHAQEALDHGHMTARMAAELARDANVGQLVLTHFSQRYTDPRAFAVEAAAVHARVIAVNDGDQVDIPRRKAAATS